MHETRKCIFIVDLYLNQHEGNLELFELEALLKRFRYLVTYLEHNIDDQNLISRSKCFVLELVTHIDTVKRRPGVQIRKKVTRFIVDQLLKKISQQSKKVA